jgi:lipoate-protein ligase A
MKGEKNDECKMMNDECRQSSLIGDATHHSSFITHHSSFSLLLDPPAAGAWNMAVDETLLEAAAAEGLCTLRFYQWAEPTLSLGYFQAYADRDGHEASRGCAVVRRPSGGGAILHDIDLTYSLAVPDHHPLAVDRLRTYRVVHHALIEVLAGLGIEASLFAPGGTAGSPSSAGNAVGQANRATPRQPDLPRREPFLCFQRRAPGDVLVEGEKIAGSAQRRCRGAVLQHGSVLLARSAAAPELVGLKELTARTIPVEEFIQSWLARLSGALAIRWQSGSLGEAHRRRAAQLATEKYGSPTWINCR